MKKRAISVLLCVLLVFTCLSIQTTEVSAATRTKISSVTLGKSSVAYTGKAITQSKIVVKAKVGGKTKTLKKGTDYTVSYKNNKNVGTG